MIQTKGCPGPLRPRCGPGAQWRGPGTHGDPTFGPEGGHPPDVLVGDVDRHGQGGGVGVTQLVVVVGLRHTPALVGDALGRGEQSEGGV